MHHFYPVRTALVLLAFGFSAQAQTESLSLSLNECVGKALDYQFSVRQATNNVQSAKSDRLASAGGLMPSLNAGAGNFYNSGLTIDPVTNEVNRSGLSTASGSLSAQWTLFDGFQTWNAYRQSQVQVALAEAQRDEARNSVALNTASQFLAVLLADEAVRIAEEQEAATAKQKDRSQKLLSAGAIASNQYLSVEAQWMADIQRSVAARNQYSLALLALKQLMGLSVATELSLVRPQNLPKGPSPVLALAPDAIYQASVEKQPLVRAAAHQLMASHYAVKRAQGARVPSLSLSGQLSTSYSDRARRLDGFTTDILPVGYWMNGADPITVYSVIQTPKFADISFSDQINDNVRQFVGVNLSVPLFNGFRIENGVRRAQIAQANAELQVQQQRDTYRQSVERAHADAVAAWSQYDASVAAEQSAERALRDATVRYEAGGISVYEFVSLKNAYLAAASNRVRALYDSQFKNYVVEFYLNNPLAL
jgi:outer membrane protein